MKSKNNFVTFLTYVTAFALWVYYWWAIGKCVDTVIGNFITSFDYTMKKITGRPSGFYKKLREKICSVPSHEEEDDTKLIIF